MSNLTLHRPPHEQATTLIKPVPRGGAIIIRPAVERGGDLMFIDELMKKHNKMVGFASTKELLSHIEEGTALIAEALSDQRSAVSDQEQSESRTLTAESRQLHTRIGYILYRDRYMKREDCGYVSQLNVQPEKHRGLVGAALVKAMFGRLPWGVRLFACWCAQDLQANHFWESIGFVPLAYRAGSRGKAQGGTGGRKETRVHIFWQRRVREGDDYAYWFPSQTQGGRMGEARLVLPIMPGTHWSDAKPLVLPGDDGAIGNGQSAKGESCKALPEGGRKPREAKVKKPIAPPCTVARNGIRMGPVVSPQEAKAKAEEAKAQAKRERPKRVKQKNDPKYIAAARELRDKYLEQVDAGLILPPSANGKYDVGRQLVSMEDHASVATPRLLNAA